MTVSRRSLFATLMAPLATLIPLRPTAIYYTVWNRILFNGRWEYIMAPAKKVTTPWGIKNVMEFARRGWYRSYRGLPSAADPEGVIKEGYSKVIVRIAQ